MTVEPARHSPQLLRELPCRDAGRDSELRRFKMVPRPADLTLSVPRPGLTGLWRAKTLRMV